MSKLPYTTNSIIKHSLRTLWMRSRERAAAMKETNYCCAYCGIKQSTAKGKEVRLDVHHMDGIDWSGICDFIRTRLLQTPDRLAPICRPCHDKQHEEDNKKKEAF
jgi:5-methylcytosine-specific restriction endonuclease McrA